MMVALRTSLVTLNLFQGPSLAIGRVVMAQVNHALMRSRGVEERAARWMLKQVQHDDKMGRLRND